MNRTDILKKIAGKLVQKINKAPHINSHPKKLEDILFQHHSPYELTIIKPQTYDNIIKQRSEDIDPNDAKKYVHDRILEEDKYRAALDIKDKNKSFTYASIVGFNLMEDPLDYPGFTYYFHLDKYQINKTLFGIVGGKNFQIKPKLGTRALISCLQQWDAHKKEFNSYEDEIIGIIDPRIEVIIPYIAIPELVIVEIEQR